ncbi:MAG: hypothetical protein ACREMR_01075, partial [Gemmatimonadales bacterium]
MTPSRRHVGPWVAYAAALWTLLFCGFHVVWAAGWYVGLDPQAARQACERTWFLIFDLVVLVVAGLYLLAVPVALALAQPWGRRLPRRLLGGLAWAGTGLLVVRGGGGAVQTLYWAATGRNVLERLLVWEVWFCLGALLFWLSVRRFSRVTGPSYDERLSRREIRRGTRLGVRRRGGVFTVSHGNPTFPPALAVVQPEMQRGVRAPRPPPLGAREQRSRADDARGSLERVVGGGERVRPAEGAHHDHRDEALADAVDREQRTPCRPHIAPGFESQRAIRDRAGERRNAPGAAWRHAERLEAGSPGLGDSRSGRCEMGEP